MSYRGINPVPMDDEKSTNNKWNKFMERCWSIDVAGISMVIQPDYVNNEKRYCLAYCDMVSPKNYPNHEEAKKDSLDFARAVLLKMLEIVGPREDDESLIVCLKKSGS